MQGRNESSASVSEARQGKREHRFHLPKFLVSFSAHLALKRRFPDAQLTHAPICPYPRTDHTLRNHCACCDDSPSSNSALSWRRPSVMRTVEFGPSSGSKTG